MQKDSDKNYKSLLVNVEQHVATVTLNRPEIRNAFNDEMIEAGFMASSFRIRLISLQRKRRQWSHTTYDVRLINARVKAIS